MKRRKKRVVLPELKDYIERNGLTQEGFAEKLKVSQGLVWQWIHGQTEITKQKAVAIEALTQINRNRLMFPKERVA